MGFDDTSKNTTSGPELLPKLSVGEFGFDTLRKPAQMNQSFRRENGFVFDDAECFFFDAVYVGARGVKGEILFGDST